MKSTSPEPLIHRPLFIFYFAYSPLHLVSVSVVLNEAGCFPPWSGDTAGPPSHIYSSLVTMTRNINTRVLLNQVWNKGSSGSLPRPMTHKQIHQLKLCSLSSMKRILYLVRKRPFQDKVLLCYKNCCHGSSEHLTKLHIRKVSCIGEVSSTVPSWQLAATWSGVGGTGFGYWLHQVLVISIPPAPPADLGLSTAGNDSSIALVPVREQDTTVPSQRSHSDALCSYPKWDYGF